MMSKHDPMQVDAYDYDLPQHLIATKPAEPKDSAKLLVYDRKNDMITHAIFRDILDFIPPKTAVILNDTKVIKARIFGQKESGGKIELLINSPLEENRFLVYIRGRVKVGTALLFEKGLRAVVERVHADGTREVRFFHNEKELDFPALHAILEKIGHIPLPPYIKREDTLQDVEDYQTLFAKKIGAVAAPTASLHFTPSLFEKMKKRFDTAYITLHVGAGTFKPVEVDKIEKHKMHSEYYEIAARTEQIINSKQKILAVGTTVTRTIEYYVRTGLTQGESDLFLHPKNPPRRVDFLLTNFHLPKSTLLMLVASFVGLEKALEIYHEAITKEYHFFSYGDAMLIL
jgi:S-adenosylmethionine:tRNA ribosyltransferase-isomerase